MCTDFFFVLNSFLVLPYCLPYSSSRVVTGSCDRRKLPTRHGLRSFSAIGETFCAINLRKFHDMGAFCINSY
jgi:hypothetical protein